MSLRKELERRLAVVAVMVGNSICLYLPGDMVMLKSPPITVKCWENFSRLSNTVELNLSSVRSTDIN